MPIPQGFFTSYDNWLNRLPFALDWIITTQKIDATPLPAAAG